MQLLQSGSLNRFEPSHCLLLQVLACATRSSSREQLLHAQGLLEAVRRDIPQLQGDAPTLHFSGLLLQVRGGLWEEWVVRATAGTGV